MTSPILVTKFFIPPARPELVFRHRLIEQLNSGLERKLTLISAPAGFGKTTLVAEWLEKIKSDQKSSGQMEIKIAWLSLDEEDNQPLRFLSYFITALNRISASDQELGKSALNKLQLQPPAPVETILTDLINEIANFPEKILFVLDDFHLIDNPSIQEAVNFILEHTPPQMHLVITTREDPLLPLSRLRARRQLTEVRASDLRFSIDETADFFNRVMGLNLSAENIAALEARTEGWIAGLQLAAVSLQGQDDAGERISTFSGSHRLVMDYLIEEVLNQQPQRIRSFLLQTAVLKRMNASLCNTLTEDRTSQQTLENLDRANLFVILWMRIANGFAITTSLPICYFSSCEPPARTRLQFCIQKPVNGMNRINFLLMPSIMLMPRRIRACGCNRRTGLAAVERWTELDQLAQLGEKPAGSGYS